MLIKEYRVLMPLSVAEYRLAQLYMIQKKSRLESSGAGSGVEIIKNEPYENGPGGSGQYTYKIYHIGNRIPVWIRNVLPSTALEAHEEAWNAYPYTRTRYSCPLISHFAVEVDTKYVDDAGTAENMFELSPEELRNRVIDVLDFVRDPISSHEYCPEEDPKLYKSEKTQRGPLNEKWVEEFVRDGKPIMCAYKLCKVEFRYWGLQTRAERWIHELALRGTMLRAHRQAWVWQDEWVGLEIEDIRRLEGETQRYLSTLMSPPICGQKSIGPKEAAVAINGMIGENGEAQIEKKAGKRDENMERLAEETEEDEHDEEDEKGDEAAVSSSDGSFCSDSDQFFDCFDKFPVSTDLAQHRQPLVRWSSELLVGEAELYNDKSPPHTPRLFSPNRSLLILIFHGDLFPKSSADSKITDINTFRTTLDSLISLHYPQLKGQVHVQCVTCGSEMGQTAQMLSGLFPVPDSFNPSLVSLLATDTVSFDEAIQSAILNANRVFNSFKHSEAGKSFGPDGEIFVVGDFIGGILMYEALARTAEIRESGGEHQRARSTTMSKSPAPQASVHSSPYRPGYPASNDPLQQRNSEPPHNFFNFDEPQGSAGQKATNCVREQLPAAKQKSAPPSACRQMSSSSQDSSAVPPGNCSSMATLSFRPSAAFLLGCPLALVLMQRKLSEVDQQQLALHCDQLFNIFYALDKCAVRLETVLNSSLSVLSSLKVPRYPLGDGRDIHFDQSVSTPPMVWGSRRVDQELYCPPEMNSLPTLALPSILHASYWESKDLSAFLLRQFLRTDEISSVGPALNTEQPPFEFQVPLTVWNRRRTRFKVANLAANHQANDLIVVEGTEQVIIHAKFCYGPMDLVVLSYENVLVYVLPNGGDWFLKGVETTDKHGRLNIDLGQTLPIGLHNVRLIVQGDHTYLSVNIAIVSPGTPVVVFSIDGSLTASVSVTGRDPRLRPGAVDVVRFWQQQGYLIIYLTARPDMQQRLVSAWLATHNFPHGLLFFTPSLSTEPLRQKTQYLKHLLDMGVHIQAAYGSAKDIQVYSNAGLEPECIFKVGGAKRRGCVSLDDGYCAHLHDLHSGKVAQAQPVYGGDSVDESPHQQVVAQQAVGSPMARGGESLQLQQQQTGAEKAGGRRTAAAVRRMQRTMSFGPRTGRYSATKKVSQASTMSTNY